MNNRAKLLRDIFFFVALVVIALLWSYSVTGCKDNAADPENYFIREFELRAGETKVFYKSGNKTYQMTYDGFTSVGWGRYYWPGIDGFKNVQIIAPEVKDKRFQMMYPDAQNIEVWVLEQTPSKASVRLTWILPGGERL